MDHKLTMSDSTYRRAKLLIHQRKRLQRYINFVLDTKPLFANGKVLRLQEMKRVSNIRLAIIFEVLLEGME